MVTKLIARLREFKIIASSSFPIKKMIFFGSLVQGKGKKWSDIDLIIVSDMFRKVRPLNRGLNLYDYWTLDYPVDFICYSPEEFEKAKKRIGIVSEAIKNGITI